MRRAAPVGSPFFHADSLTVGWHYDGAGLCCGHRPTAASCCVGPRTGLLPIGRFRCIAGQIGRRAADSPEFEACNGSEPAHSRLARIRNFKKSNFAVDRINQQS